MNNPLNAIDPDGRLVIFINGFTPYKSELGTSAYWDGEFDKKVMAHLNDYNSVYLDGTSGGRSWITFNPFCLSVESRISAGHFVGMQVSDQIFKAITDDKGNIKETIKVITHSMGAAYAKGFITALLDYCRKHNIPTSVIEFEADFAPYQPTKQKANPEIPTYQFSHSKDRVAGEKKMEGTEKKDTSSDKDQGHSISSFVDQIRNLPQGKYKVENGKIIPM